MFSTCEEMEQLLNDCPRYETPLNTFAVCEELEHDEQVLSAPSSKMAPPPLPRHPLAWKLPEQEDLDGGASETTDDAASDFSLTSRSSQDTDITVSSSGKIRRRKASKSKKKRPIGLSEVLLDLLDVELRESTLKMLSNHMREKRTEDITYYHNVALYLFNCSTTPVILLQEVLSAVAKMYAGGLTLRESRRCGNTLTIYQSFAANPETRQEFIAAQLPNYIIPFVICKFTDDVYETLRVLSLSVMGILCQAHEDNVVKWALQAGMVQMCIHAVEYGSEPSKVIAIHIIECLLLNEDGLHRICHPDCKDLQLILKVCADLIKLLARLQDFSPRIVFHITRTYVLLCNHPRAKALLRDSLPPQLKDETFQDLMQNYPPLAELRQELLTIMREDDQSLPTHEGRPTLAPEVKEANNSGGSGRTCAGQYAKQLAPQRDAKPSALGSPKKSPVIKQYHLFGSPKADSRQLPQQQPQLPQQQPQLPQQQLQLPQLQPHSRNHTAASSPRQLPQQGSGYAGHYNPFWKKDPQQQAPETAHLAGYGCDSSREDRRLTKDEMYSEKVSPAQRQRVSSTGERKLDRQRLPKDEMYSEKVSPTQCQRGSVTGENKLDHHHNPTISCYVGRQLDFRNAWSGQVVPRGSASSAGSCDHISVSGDRKSVETSHAQDYLSSKSSSRMLGAEARSILGAYEDTVNRHMRSMSVPQIQEGISTVSVPPEGNTPIRPVDFDKQLWSSAARRREVLQLHADVVLNSGPSSVKSSLSGDGVGTGKHGNAHCLSYMPNTTTKWR